MENYGRRYFLTYMWGILLVGYIKLSIFNRKLGMDLDIFLLYIYNIMSFTGVVDHKNQEKGYGFIKQDNGGSIFFHASSLGGGEDGYAIFEGLRSIRNDGPEAADRVEFEIVDGQDGKTKAHNVRVV